VFLVAKVLSGGLKARIPDVRVGPEVARLRDGRFDLLPEAESLSLASPRPRLERGRTAKLARRTEGRMPEVRESKQREGHPTAAPFGFVSTCRAFRRGFLPWRKGIGIHANAS
jgi:hypothetical protein